MDVIKSRHAKSADFWNDDARQLATVVGGIALGAYALMNPRVFKLALLLGAAELFRRNAPFSLSLPPIGAHRPRTGEGLKAKAAITIACEPQAAYSYWRDLKNAPKFMSAVENVRVVSENVAVWSVRPLQGKNFTWVGETTDDVAGERIGWRSIGSDVLSGGGEVKFRNGLKPGTTEVALRQELFMPVAVSNWITRSLMTRQLEETLRKLKQILETGEIATVEGQPAGERSIAGRIAHEYVKPVLIPS